jgi:hypothetical protein
VSDLELTAEASLRCTEGAGRILRATASGEWRAAEELLAEALAFHDPGGERGGEWSADVSADVCVDVCVDVAGVDHLDAATLQIFLALRLLQKQKDAALHFLNVSPSLLGVLRCVGAARALGMEGDVHA